jgi:hypothetical protein
VETPFQFGDSYYYWVTLPGEKRPSYRRLATKEVPPEGLAPSKWVERSTLVRDQSDFGPRTTVDGTLQSPNGAYCVFRTELDLSFVGQLRIRKLASAGSTAHDVHYTAPGRPSALWQCDAQPGDFCWDPSEQGLLVSHRSQGEYSIKFHLPHSSEAISATTSGLEWIETSALPNFHLLGEYLFITACKNFKARRGGYQCIFVAKLWDKTATLATIRQVRPLSGSLVHYMSFRQHLSGLHFRSYEHKESSALPTHLNLCGLFRDQLYFSTVGYLPVQPRLFVIDLKDDKAALVGIPRSLSSTC